MENKISEFISAGVIDFACYIEHMPEDDEKKAHKHVLFFPSGIVDTNIFFKEFAEKDPTNAKPLGCTIAVSSKFDDWYLYAVHDKRYLASKGQARKHHYTYSQIRNTDEDFFREMVNNIDRSKFIGSERVINAVKDGMPFEELVLLGAVPIQLINQYKFAYECINGALYRNGRKTHTPKSTAKKKPTLLEAETLQDVDGEKVVSADGEVLDIPFE
ncbi:MAG: hypothetical protein IJX30_03510 [Clostridia bacterium]|nr:hypothetical protein [Clostridia bacterium]